MANDIGSCIPLEPTSYSAMTVGDMWGSFQCDNFFSIDSPPRPIHNASTWMMMRGVYLGIVGPERSSIHQPISHQSGFGVPFEVVQNFKGRGVFAALDPDKPVDEEGMPEKGNMVPKGTLVWTSRQQSAHFSTGEEYRRFLHSIPDDIACDVLQWAYVQSFADEEYRNNPKVKNKRKGAARVCVDLDEGSFMNSGGWSDYSYDTDEEVANVGCDEEAALEFEGGCARNYFALRDIMMDEEFLCSYGDFAISGGWKWFGL
eukprot:CAMPEP_0171310866 /NCGR_PEP_ID=MMETSP0816-20121228/21058_1 /TAXON_ID=420281 /ORGANISM="Proboscia inermis, Strain CCAP1064/1" /LENGTH=258 /DNA_ID=CAMNT_0011795237 /DNA_START=20 /DNA_END=796 /DNA_ORIENTATION=-